jgi:arylsulfatase A-like enzyme
VRVPLIVKLPDRAAAGTRVSVPVGLIDVMPTVLDAAGIPAPAGLEGRSLLALARGAAPPDPRPVFSEALMGSARANVYEQKAVRTDAHAVIDTPGLGARRVYDRRADPWEQHDVAGARGAWTEAASRPEAWSATMQALLPRGDRAGEALDPARERQLKALGYLH